MKNLLNKAYLYITILSRSVIGETIKDIRAMSDYIDQLEEEREFLLTQLEAATTVVKTKAKKKP